VAGPRATLIRARASFLSACGWGARRELVASLERRDRQLQEALRDGVQVVLWFEHDLYDQLQLIDALTLAHEAGGEPELIEVGAFPGKPSFRGLGELNERELETLWPSRRRTTPRTLSAAAAAWDALREPEPSALADLASTGVRELPFLGAALLRLLEELPDVHDGLSGTERRALEAVAAGAATPIAAFVAAQKLESTPFYGDAWFFRTLAGLGRGKGRLVELDDGTELPAPPPLGDAAAFVQAPLRLTANGKRVLRREADRVELLGVERWIGGTHVTTESSWRWDGAARRLSS
jgi:hypothetical protein